MFTSDWLVEQKLIGNMSLQMFLTEHQSTHFQTAAESESNTVKIIFKFWGLPDVGPQYYDQFYDKMQLDRRIRHVLTAGPSQLEEAIEEGPISSDSALTRLGNRGDRVSVFGSKNAFSWSSVDRFGNKFWGLMILSQVKSVQNFC